MFFNILSRLVIAFLPRSKCLLISWLQPPSAVILEPPKIKSVTVTNVYPPIFHEVIGPDAMILVFWMLSFKPTFSLFSITCIKRFFSSLFSAIRVVSPANQWIWLINVSRCKINTQKSIAFLYIDKDQKKKPRKQSNCCKKINK